MNLIVSRLFLGFPPVENNTWTFPWVIFPASKKTILGRVHWTFLRRWRSPETSLPTSWHLILFWKVWIKNGSELLHYCWKYRSQTVSKPNWKNDLTKIMCELFGMVKWTFQRLSDLQISNKRVTLKHLVVVFFGSSCYEVVFCVRNIIEYVLHLENPPKKTRKNMQSTWLIKHFEIWCLMIIPIPRVQVPGSWVVVSNAFYFHHVHPEPWSFMILFDLGIFVQVGWFNDSTTD